MLWGRNEPNLIFTLLEDVFTTDMKEWMISQLGQPHRITPFVEVDDEPVYQDLVMIMVNMIAPLVVGFIPSEI
jgi:hypothetical protein